jgi:hypothetical protein
MSGLTVNRSEPGTGRFRLRDQCLREASNPQQKLKTRLESIKTQRRTAVSEMIAEQAHLFVHNVVLGVLKNESRTTRSVLAAVPNVNLDYRPDPCAKTANELLRHIASADSFFLKSVVDGVFVPGSVKIPEDVKTPEEWNLRLRYRCGSILNRTLGGRRCRQSQPGWLTRQFGSIECQGVESRGRVVAQPEVSQPECWSAAVLQAKNEDDIKDLRECIRP